MAKMAERPERTRPRGATRRTRRLIVWSVIAAVLVALLVGSLVYTEQSSFCPACHEMQPYYSAWKTGGHATNAQCVDCHVDPGLIAHLAHKPQALKEVWDHFTRDNRFPNYSVKVPNGRCTQCHPKVDKKIGTVFSHALHQKNATCVECHGAVGHLVTLESLSAAGVLKKGAGVLPVPTGVTPSALKGHKVVVCQKCHDQAAMKCSQCHTAPHEARGECSQCHQPGTAFVFSHPAATTECAPCHTKPSGHVATTAPCASCHRDGGKSWAFLHPSAKDCSRCHKAPANHFGADCAGCHTPSIPFAKTHFNHPTNTGEHTYRSFACAKCHPNGYATASCTCHGGKPPSGD